MAVIECDSKHCVSSICQIFNECETRKKFGTKTDDLTPLQKAIQEKQELLKQVEEMKAKINATPVVVSEKKTDKVKEFSDALGCSRPDILLPNKGVSEMTKKVGRPKKEKIDG